jgi:HSP20 family protein
MGELVPENRGQVPVHRDDTAVQRTEHSDPFWAFHREVSRFFDDAFRGFFHSFDIAPFSFSRAAGWPNLKVVELHHEVRLFEGSLSTFDRSREWPTVEVSDRGQEIEIRVELPGFDETEVKVELSDSALIIRGESRSEREDGQRLFSWRAPRSFERRIPLAWDIEADKVAASFRHGVLVVTLPKPKKSPELTRRIPINAG